MSQIEPKKCKLVFGLVCPQLLEQVLIWHVIRPEINYLISFFKCHYFFKWLSSATIQANTLFKLKLRPVKADSDRPTDWLISSHRISVNAIFDFLWFVIIGLCFKTVVYQLSDVYHYIHLWLHSISLNIFKYKNECSLSFVKLCITWMPFECCFYWL